MYASCRDCQLDVCLKHRFGADHNCRIHYSTHRKEDESKSSMSRFFLESLKIRMGGECGAATTAGAPDAEKRARDMRGHNRIVEAH